MIIAMILLYVIPLVGCFWTFNKCSITYIVNTFKNRDEMLISALIPIVNLIILYFNLKDIIKNEL